MESSDILVSNPDDAVTRIQLNRPSVRNAYRTQTCLELLAAIERFRDDDGQRVLVIASGHGAFCSGGDLTSQAEIDVAAARQFGHGVVIRDGIHAVLRALDALDKPVVAAIDGAAIAGGLALALSCHLRIASDRSRLGDVATGVGLLPDDGGAWLFPQFMGIDRALKMSLLREIYSASTALELGLVTEVVPADTFDERVGAVVTALAEGAPLAMRSTIRLMRRAANQSLDQSLEDAAAAVNYVNHSADVSEGIAAFMQRRAAKFTGT